MNPAQLIATNLAALPHPDGTPRQLPGFATQLLPEQMAQQVNQTALELGEAIVNLLETSGYTITYGTPTPPADTPAQIANVHCVYCDARVLQLNITNPARVMTTQHFTTTKCPQA